MSWWTRSGATWAGWAVGACPTHGTACTLREARYAARSLPSVMGWRSETDGALTRAAIVWRSDHVVCPGECHAPQSHPIGAGDQHVGASVRPWDWYRRRPSRRATACPASARTTTRWSLTAVVGWWTSGHRSLLADQGPGRPVQRGVRLGRAARLTTRQLGTLDRPHGLPTRPDRVDLAGVRAQVAVPHG